MLLFGIQCHINAKLRTLSLQSRSLFCASAKENIAEPLLFLLQLLDECAVVILWAIFQPLITLKADLLRYGFVAFHAGLDLHCILSVGRMVSVGFSGLKRSPVVFRSFLGIFIVHSTSVVVVLAWTFCDMTDTVLFISSQFQAPITIKTTLSLLKPFCYFVCKLLFKIILSTSLTKSCKEEWEKQMDVEVLIFQAGVPMRAQDYSHCHSSSFNR